MTKEKENLSEIDNLQNEFERVSKELKKERDNLEDCKEELEDCERILKKEKEKCRDLQNQLDAKSKESMKLKDDLERAKLETTDKAGELDLRMQSLSFIQEILAAIPVQEADTKGVYDRVETLYNFIKGDLRDCITKLFGTAIPEDEHCHYFVSGLERWATMRKKDWIQGKTAIAFVGEFSAGKTSIVNRILSQDNPDVPLLPVSAKATTAVPTYISGGVATQFNFVTPDNVQKNISEETFRRVNKEVLEQVKGVSSLLQYFVMRYKNEILNNLSILDTPGFSSNDKEDAERTIEVINECDALFWVFDVNNGDIDRSSIGYIEIIRDNLEKPLYVVINKVDTKAKKDVDDVERRIRQTLEKEEIPVEGCIRFSPTTPLEEMMNVIGSVTRDDAVDSYLDDLTEWVNSLETAYVDLVKKLNSEYEELSTAGNKLVDKYVKSIKRLEKACENLANKPKLTSTWLGFGDDVYSMDESEYNEFFKLINDIYSKRVSELEKLYDDQMDTQREIQQAYSDYVDRKAELQEISTCNKQLKKYINLLKKGK